MPHYSLGTIYITKKTHRYINQVLQTKRLSYGPFCKKFEKDFAKLHQSSEGIVCSSGTNALRVIFEALKIKYQWPDNSEIIVPATTFVASINAIIHSNLRPVLVDVEEDSFNINPKLIEAKISKKSKAIMPVHLFGKPSNMSAIDKISKKHNLVVIEDCCETIASHHQNKVVGSWGIAGAFSTNSAHILATGIGGVITTSDSELALLMRGLINHGRSSNYLSIDDDDKIESSKKFNQLVDSRFIFPHIGFSFRLSELEAAVGLVQLEDIKILIEKRVENVLYLNKNLAHLEKWLKLPQQDKDNTHVYMAYPLVLTTKAKKIQSNCLKNLIYFLESKQIETRPLMPIINQPAYKEFKFKQTDFPVSSYLLNSGFYVGCHQDLTKDELDYFIKTITSFFDNPSF